MGKKIRVLMIVFNLAVANGVSSFVMNYFRKLDHSKIIMDFVVYQDVPTPYRREILQVGGKIHVISSIKDFKTHLEESRKIIENGQYDIVHDNILILSYFIMHYAKEYMVPVRILHSHNSKLGASCLKLIRNSLFLPFLVNLATDYFACSDLAATCMFGKRKYTFVPNIVDDEKMIFQQSARNQVRENMGVTNKLVIATVGRLAKQKNPFYAIDIISELKKYNNNIEYWWIGNGPLEKSVKEYIQKKCAASYIHLLGRRTDVADLYQGADVFFLPSIFEGLPVTGIEAQAMGLPCFVSDTITKEFIYTDLVKTFSIQNSPKTVAERFAQWLMTLRKDEDRINYAQVLEDSPFSNRHAGEYLGLVYENLLNLHTV